MTNISTCWLCNSKHKEDFLIFPISNQSDEKSKNLVLCKDCKSILFDIVHASDVDNMSMMRMRGFDTREALESIYNNSFINLLLASHDEIDELIESFFENNKTDNL